MEKKVASGNESQLSSDSVEEKPIKGPVRFYRKRNRFYTLLLLFVVVIGLPMVAVPNLRNRLSARIHLLKAAVAENVNAVIAEVGANQEPFPAEYEKEVPSVPQAFKLPPSSTVYTQTQRVYTPVPSDVAQNATPSVLNLDGSPSVDEGETIVEMDPAEVDAPEESGPAFQQGEAERDAYDLLLQSNSQISELVMGSDASLTFDTWDAAHRGEDIYWVRLKFKSEGNPDREYIWQVKLGSKEITPLSYHARSLS
jgi:hypothetical protein